MKKWLLTFALIVITGLLFYFDPFHKPVETIESLIGQNFDYAHKYFGTDPEENYQIEIKENMNEFHGGILSKLSIIKDTTVQVYTWYSFNHKSTIWIAKTTNERYEIIDAIRYKNDVRF